MSKKIATSLDLSSNRINNLGIGTNASDAVNKSQLDEKLTANSPITGNTKTKITYDSNGLILSGSDLADSDIPTLTTSKLNDFESSSNSLIDAKITTHIELPDPHIQYMLKPINEGENYIPLINVQATSTGNVATLSGLQTVDGIPILENELVFLKNQTTTSQNGVWKVSTGSWVRVAGYDSNDEIRNRIVTQLKDGTTNKIGTQWICTNTTNIIVGTTSLTFAQIPRGIGTGSHQASAGNHSHSSIATSANSSFGSGIRLRYTNYTATATCTTNDIWIRLSGTTALQTLTLYDGTTLTNNSGYRLRITNNSTQPWTLGVSASNTINELTSFSLPSGYTVDLHNIADNKWITNGMFLSDRLLTESDIPILTTSKLSDFETSTNTLIDTKINTHVELPDPHTQYILESNIGVANGIPSLGPDAKILSSQLPTSIVGQVNYKGNWNASTNDPVLPTTPVTSGEYYIVTTTGSTSLGDITDWNVGDWIIANGSTWSKVDNTDAVVTVAGKTGAVTLNRDDVQLDQVDNTSDIDKPISTATQTALNNKSPLITTLNDNPASGVIPGTASESLVAKIQRLRDNVKYILNSWLTGAISTVLTSNLQTNRALVSNSSGKIAVLSTVNDAELGTLTGITSNIQTQLNGKADKSAVYDVWGEFGFGYGSYREIFYVDLPNAVGSYINFEANIQVDCFSSQNANNLQHGTIFVGGKNENGTVTWNIRQINGNETFHAVDSILLIEVLGSNTRVSVAKYMYAYQGFRCKVDYIIGYEYFTKVNGSEIFNTTGWGNVPNYGYAPVLQSTGTSTNTAMSQNATTLALNGKSNVGHGHAISDVANLQGTLDDKVSKTVGGTQSIASNVTIGGDLTVSNNGVKFHDDPFGGSSDSAGMRVVSRSGEDLSLELYVANDSADWINLSVPNINGAKVNGNTIYNAGNFNPDDKVSKTDPNKQSTVSALDIQNANVGKWTTNAEFARFGHKNHNEDLYGFLQHVDGAVYIRGASVTTDSADDVNIGCTDTIRFQKNGTTHAFFTGPNNTLYISEPLSTAVGSEVTTANWVNNKLNGKANTSHTHDRLNGVNATYIYPTDWATDTFLEINGNATGIGMAALNRTTGNTWKDFSIYAKKIDIGSAEGMMVLSCAAPDAINRRIRLMPDSSTEDKKKSCIDILTNENNELDILALNEGIAWKNLNIVGLSVDINNAGNGIYLQHFGTTKLTVNANGVFVDTPASSNNSTQVATTAWVRNYASPTSHSHTKLATVNAGSNTQPVYFVNGVPTPISGVVPNTIHLATETVTHHIWEYNTVCMVIHRTPGPTYINLNSAPRGCILTLTTRVPANFTCNWVLTRSNTTFYASGWGGSSANQYIPDSSHIVTCQLYISPDIDMVMILRY